jgi:hypothetical protein
MENLREEKGGGPVASHNLFPLAAAGPVLELVTYYVTNFPLQISCFSEEKSKVCHIIRDKLRRGGSEGLTLNKWQTAVGGWAALAGRWSGQRT